MAQYTVYVYATRESESRVWDIHLKARWACTSLMMTHCSVYDGNLAVGRNYLFLIYTTMQGE